MAILVYSGGIHYWEIFVVLHPCVFVFLVLWLPGPGLTAGISPRLEVRISFYGHTTEIRRLQCVSPQHPFP